MPRALPSLLFLLATAAAALAQGGPPPARVQLDPVRSESLEQWREVTGSLRAVHRSTIAAEVEGRVVEMPVREGDRVEKGAVLARLDDRLLGLAVAGARAELASKRAAVSDAEAQREKAARDLPRAQRLFESSQAVSEQVVDDAQTALLRAEAGVARAEAGRRSAEVELERARELLGDAVVTAPFPGTVVGKHVDSGAWVRTGDGIVDLASVDELEAWLDVPERYLVRIGALRNGLQLRIPALGRVLEASLSTVVPDADPLSRTLTVRVAVPRTEGLAPGMSVVGLAPTGRQEDSLTVDRDAILRDDAGEFVYFDGGGRAMVARVETLFTAGDRVAIHSSQLNPGMQVVTEGHQRLFPGQPLAPMGAGGS
jgi:RND family efflux transporter MFP subunit